MIVGRNKRRIRLTSVNRLVALAKEGKAGRYWYRHARRELLKACDILGEAPWYLADILALYSPRVSVKRNIRFAIGYIQTGRHAADVMRGIRASIDHYNATGQIRGPKTGPFAKAILGDESAVVLDVYMAEAFGINQAAFNLRPVHRECCRRIERAADILGWTPAQIQAAVWSATVKRVGRVNIPAFTLTNDTLWGSVALEAA